MDKTDELKLIQNNVNFFYVNVVTLLRLRPNINISFGKKHKNAICYHFDNLNAADDINVFLSKQDDLRAFNSSIILNCFSLFEASFESLLLKELNTKKLSGIQERVMLSYIDGILKISSENNYSKEYKFITGKSIKGLFPEHEYILYKLILTFYTLRHKLIHGSASKSVLRGGTIKLDKDDNEYQELAKLIIEKLKLDIYPDIYKLDTMLLDNRVSNILVEAIFIISSRLFKNTGVLLSFMK